MHPEDRRCTRHTRDYPQGGSTQETGTHLQLPRRRRAPSCPLQPGTHPEPGPYVPVVVLVVVVVLAVPPARDASVPQVPFTTPVVVAPAASAPVVLVVPAASGGAVVAVGAVVVVVASWLEVPLSVVVLAALAGTVAPAGEPVPLTAVEVVVSLAAVVGTGTMGVGPSPVHTEVEVVEDGVVSRRVVDVLVRVCVTGTVVAGDLRVVGGAVVGAVVADVVVAGVVVAGTEVVLEPTVLGDEVTVGEVLGDEGSVVELACPVVAGADGPGPRAGVAPALDVGGDDVGGVEVVVVGREVDVVVETVPDFDGAAVVAVAA